MSFLSDVLKAALETAADVLTESSSTDESYDELDNMDSEVSIEHEESTDEYDLDPWFDFVRDILPKLR